MIVTREGLRRGPYLTLGAGESGTLHPMDAGLFEVVATWVPPQNLRPFLETISRWVGYTFDDADWVAIAGGVQGTDSDARRWYTYPICGTPRLDVAVANNVGDGPVSIRVLAEADVPDLLRVQIAAAAEIFNSYDFR